MTKVTIDRAVVEQVLSTLKGWDNHGKWMWPESALQQAKRNTTEAITSFKAALAQPPLPVQEPVAWMYQCTADNSKPVLLQHKTHWAESGTGLWIETPLYTTPPLPVQPVQEAASIIQAVTDPENQPSQYGTVTLDYHLAKLKEWEDRFEKLSDKALAQPVQPVQEPVAWFRYEDGMRIYYETKAWGDLQALYTAPPLPVQPVQRQPLTLNEMTAIEEKVYMQTTHKGKPSLEYAQALIRATEAAHNIGVKPNE